MPIDTSSNIPLAPQSDVIVVLDATQVPGLTGIAGRPRTRDSISLLGITDHSRPDGTPTRLLAVQGLALFNRGDADFVVGGNRGASAKYYAPHPNFPTGVSDALLDLTLRDQLGAVVARPTSPVALHWSAFFPDGGVPPDHKWSWNNYVLEWGTGAVILGDAIASGPLFDLGTDLGMREPWTGTLDVQFVHDDVQFVHDTGGHHVALPIRIHSRQAEVIW